MVAPSLAGTQGPQLLLSKPTYHVLSAASDRASLIELRSDVNSDGTEQIIQFPVIVASRFNHFLHKVTFGHLPRRGHLFKQNQAS